MIDIESELYTAVKSVLPVGTNTSGEYVKVPSSFPFVSMEEKDNYNNAKFQSSSLSETHSNLMYEINVYSNKMSGKKAECKSIIKLIDTKMTALNFTRTMCNPIPNLDDSTIFRMIARYVAVVNDNKQIFRR